MVDGMLLSGEKRQSAGLSDCGRPLIAEIADGVHSVGEQETCPDLSSQSSSKVTGEHQSEILSTGLTTTFLPQDVIAIVDAASKTLNRRWFWYSIAASLCWTGWAFTARVGSEEIPPATMQFVSAFGFVLIASVVLAVQRPQLTKSLRGGAYALIGGVLLGLGGIALYGAYRAGNNASIVTATTSLYPVATVLLAVTFLREKLNKLQLIGVCFAVAAILLLSS